MEIRRTSRDPIFLDNSTPPSFLESIVTLLPNDRSLHLCLTCGLCSSGCPASGLFDMDPRRFLRLAVLGADQDLLGTPWIWACTLCERCKEFCPMGVDIPALVYAARAAWPREERPSGLVRSCDAALAQPSGSAMGISSPDFREVVDEVLAEARAWHPRLREMDAPVDKAGAEYFVNQNSREPFAEAEEMAPLWKILHLAGADWTYGSVGWAAENYCMFAADEGGWERIVRNKAEAVAGLGARVWLNTE
jgi:Fe-S oxidoreductase